MNDTWEKWKPTRKVTAHGAASGAALILVILFDGPLGLTPAESVTAASAIAWIISYLIPERSQD
jgi:hypothetical protein